jgi:2-polyprenyl-6-hydroxyphenyl methylase/3-demethylubiquinone-9 3-methyltransferase
MSTPSPHPAPGFDTGSHQSFFDYYAAYSESPATLARFAAIAEVVLRLRRAHLFDGSAESLDVLDVGCNAGTQSRFWAGPGQRYTGIDINEPLVMLARERAAAVGSPARFEVASATELPFDDASFDVCLMPELLEHVRDWQRCLDEATRVLRPGGVLYLSTSSWLCPRQQEFNLPGYSWYPGFIKRRIEQRAVTDWPEVANHAKYPAVNWFSFYGLRSYLAQRGFRSYSRFDSMRLDNKGAAARVLVGMIRALPPLQLLALVATEGTTLVAVRTRGGPAR